MAQRYMCAVCEQVEEKCECVKYCSLCQGYNLLRLCADGQWYCLECREACELSPEN